MKLEQAMQIRAITPGTPSEAPRATREQRAPSPDRVSTEETRQVAAAVAAASQGAGVARAARLRDIEAAVKSGTYRPDPQKIAQEILDEAELSAKLQSLL